MVHKVWPEELKYQAYTMVEAVNQIFLGEINKTVNVSSTLLVNISFSLSPPDLVYACVFFSHIIRDEGRLSRTLLFGTVYGSRGRGQPKTRFIGDITKACGAIHAMVQQAKDTRVGVDSWKRPRRFEIETIVRDDDDACFQCACTYGNGGCRFPRGTFVIAHSRGFFVVKTKLYQQLT